MNPNRFESSKAQSMVFISSALGKNFIASTSNLEFRGCWIMAFTRRTPFQPWPTICYMHECHDQIVYCGFIKASHYVVWLLESLVVHSLRKVACGHFSMFLYGHILRKWFKSQLNELQKSICATNVMNNYNCKILTSTLMKHVFHI